MVPGYTAVFRYIEPLNFYNNSLSLEPSLNTLLSPKIKRPGLDPNSSLASLEVVISVFLLLLLK